MNKPQLSPGRFAALLFCSVAGPLATELCVLFRVDAGNAAPLVILFIGLASTLVALLIAWLVRVEDNPFPLEALSEACGRPVGVMLCYLGALLFLGRGGLLLHNFALYIARLFLPQTPFGVVLLLLFVPSFYMAVAGLRVSGYAATSLWLLLPFFIVLFIMPVDNYHFSYLLPISLADFVPSTLPALCFTAGSLVGAFFLLPHTEGRRFAAPLVWFCVVSSLFLMATLVLAVAFFGDTVLPQLLLPFDNLSSGRKGTFLERTDVLYLLLLLPLMGLSVAFYFVAYLAAVEKLMTAKQSSWIGAIILLVLAVSGLYGGEPMASIGRLNLLFLLFLALLLIGYGLVWLKRRRRHA